jgi:hypothetical protein
LLLLGAVFTNVFARGVVFILSLREVSACVIRGMTGRVGMFFESLTPLCVLLIVLLADEWTILRYATYMKPAVWMAMMGTKTGFREKNDTNMAMHP